MVPTDRSEAEWPKQASSKKLKTKSIIPSQ
jgi:hypothetical protein